jgi:hypothetical protein
MDSKKAKCAIYWLRKKNGAPVPKQVGFGSTI